MQQQYGEETRQTRNQDKYLLGIHLYYFFLAACLARPSPRGSFLRFQLLSFFFFLLLLCLGSPATMVSSRPAGEPATSKKMMAASAATVSSRLCFPMTEEICRKDDREEKEGIREGGKAIVNLAVCGEIMFQWNMRTHCIILTIHVIEEKADHSENDQG